jgi:hypothetical protein
MPLYAYGHRPENTPDPVTEVPHKDTETNESEDEN